MAIIKTDIQKGHICHIHKIEAISNKESAMRWAYLSLSKLEELSIEGLYAVADDDKSYHDGTESFSFSAADYDDVEDFILQHKDTPVGIVRISGRYQDSDVVVQVSLSYQWIAVTVDQNRTGLLSMLESFLNLDENIRKEFSTLDQKKYAILEKLEYDRNVDKRKKIGSSSSYNLISIGNGSSKHSKAIVVHDRAAHRRSSSARTVSKKGNN